MPTHADMAVKLLRDAAEFFRTVARDNPAAKKDMTENAAAFEQAAELLERSPTGTTNGKSHAAMSGGLLRDAAGFFRGLGAANPPIKDQMDHNAAVFEQLGARVAAEPLGIME